MFDPAARPNDGFRPAPSSEPNRDNSVDLLLIKAVALEREGKFHKAIDICNTVLVKDGGNISARHTRANAFILLGLLREAIIDLNLAVPMAPFDPDLLGTRAYALYRLAAPDLDEATFSRARRDVERALVFKSGDPRLLSIRGMIAAATDDPDRAIGDLSHAIAHGCDDSEVRYLRAYSFASNGEINRAIADLTQTVRMSPERPDGYAARAILYINKNDLEHAIGDLDQLVRLQPDDASGYFYRAFALLMRGENAKALADFESVARLEPKSAFAHCLVAIVAYLHEPQSDRALAAMDKAVENEPDLVVYPAIRCALNVKHTKYLPALKDLARCGAILLESRWEWHPILNPTNAKFGIEVSFGMPQSRWLVTSASINYRERRLSAALGTSHPSDYPESGSEIAANEFDADQTFIKLMTLLVAKVAEH